MKTLLNVGGTRVIWWRGIAKNDNAFDLPAHRIAPAFTLVTPSGELLVRFGRDGWQSLTERYAGSHGFPRYWYGPMGLSICWSPRS